MPQRGWSVLVVLTLVLGGSCVVTTPSPMPSPTTTVIPPTATLPVVPTPTRSTPPQQTASPAPTGSPGVTALALETADIPAEYTQGTFAFRSLGDQLIWSARAGSATKGNGSLYRFVPGTEAPELVFLNPRDNCYLGYIAGSSVGYAFSEYCYESRGRRTDPPWRVWFVRGPGEEPVMLDEGGDARQENAWIPQVAMNDRHIAWTPDYITGDERGTELRLVAIDALDEPTTLVSYNSDDGYVDFPALHGTELWYGVSDNDWDAGTEQPRVETIDLADSSQTPAVYGAGQRAFMPAPGDEVVVWKGGGLEGFSALSPGILTVYWRDSGEIQALPLPGREREHISYPSVGDRFVAWWEGPVQRSFDLFDLKTQQFRRIAEYDPLGDEGISRPSLCGDLLAFVYRPDENHHSLRWAHLPE